MVPRHGDEAEPEQTPEAEDEGSPSMPTTAAITTLPASKAADVFSKKLRLHVRERRHAAVLIRPIVPRYARSVACLWSEPRRRGARVRRAGVSIPHDRGGSDGSASSSASPSSASSGVSP